MEMQQWRQPGAADVTVPFQVPTAVEYARPVQLLQFRGIVVDAHLVTCRRRGWVGVSAGARNRSASAAVTSAMTVSHAPGVCCLNRRADGYQGLSVRLSIQRQSDAFGSMIQTGLPIAPARC